MVVIDLLQTWSVAAMLHLNGLLRRSKVHSGPTALHLRKLVEIAGDCAATLSIEAPLKRVCIVGVLAQLYPLLVPHVHLEVLVGGLLVLWAVARHA